VCGSRTLLADVIRAPGQVERVRRFWVRSPDRSGAFDNRRLAGLNDRLRELCSRHPGVRFAATPAGSIGSDGNLRPECSDDGPHFTAEGNRVWAAALRRDVQAAGE
jgi:hypothetical protein